MPDEFNRDKRKALFALNPLWRLINEQVASDPENLLNIYGNLIYRWAVSSLSLNLTH